jgi:hypothetical protein
LCSATRIFTVITMQSFCSFYRTVHFARVVVKTIRASFQFVALLGLLHVAVVGLRRLWIALAIDALPRSLLLTWVTLAIVFIAFWTFSGLYIVLDLYKKPRFLHVYKIQQSRNSPLKTSAFTQALYVVVFNQIVISVPVFLLIGYPLLEWRQCAVSFPDFPSLKPCFQRHRFLCSG